MANICDVNSKKQTLNFKYLWKGGKEDHRLKNQIPEQRSCKHYPLSEHLDIVVASLSCGTTWVCSYAACRIACVLWM